MHTTINIGNNYELYIINISTRVKLKTVRENSQSPYNILLRFKQVYTYTHIIHIIIIIYPVIKVDDWSSWLSPVNQLLEGQF